MWRRLARRIIGMGFASMYISKTFTASADVFSVDTPDYYTLDFLGGNDRLTTSQGHSTASMGDGDDVVLIRGGAVSADGGAGSDLFNLYVPTTAVHLDGGADNDRFNFYADATRVDFQGGAGNDNFYGNAHTIYGSLYGGDGNDGFYGLAAEGGRTPSLYGGAGDDVYRVTPGTTAVIVELANEGIDTVQVATGASFTLGANLENLTVVDFATGGGAPVLRGNGLDNTIIGGGTAETMYGLDGNDVLRGNGGGDSLWGANGDDRLYGGGGDDTLHGQAGNDILNGGDGSDLMIGGDGNDTYYVDTFGESDVVVERADASGGWDTVHAAVEVYWMPAGIEEVFGSTVHGTSGDDVLHGSGRPNDLQGIGFGTLYGGAGDDLLYGNGSDLYGGSGSDTFAYKSSSDSTPGHHDTLYDFQSGVDRIDLSAIDANPLLAGDQAFTLVSNFTGHAGEVVFQPATTDTDYQVGDDYGYLKADVDGDGRTDLEIWMWFGYDFAPSDLVL